jgi:V8-like Glu-specific endopeptidase
VIASPTHDLVITAAHCISGTAAGWSFAPDYDQGRTPFGVWTVTAAFVDRAWARSQDAQHDFALLRLARKTQHGHSIGVQDMVGGNVLAPAPRTSQRILDVAYNAGVDDQPIACRPRAYYTDGYPSFNCHGYVGGSSGSPWLTHAWWTPHLVVRGVIGGLHQGGCFEYTSYSSRFTLAIYRLVYRAVVNHRGDIVPVAGSDGC